MQTLQIVAPATRSCHIDALPPAHSNTRSLRTVYCLQLPEPPSIPPLSTRIGVALSSSSGGAGRIFALSHICSDRTSAHLYGLFVCIEKTREVEIRVSVESRCEAGRIRGWAGKESLLGARTLCLRKSKSKSEASFLERHRAWRLISKVDDDMARHRKALMGGCQRKAPRVDAARRRRKSCCAREGNTRALACSTLRRSVAASYDCNEELQDQQSTLPINQITD